jgi:DNA-binding transcriptional ArsR family regulator
LACKGGKVRDIQKVLAALASPVRREILSLIWDRELSAGDIAAAFPVTKPTISQHLAVLREAGLASSTAVGTSRRYRARPEALRGLQGALVSPGKWVNADHDPRDPPHVSDVRTKPVVVARTIVDTSPAVTFTAFTDPAVYSRWLGVPVSIQDGRFACTMEWGTTVRGRYELVCPPELIVLRWDFEDDNVPVPGGEMTGYLRIQPYPPGALVEVHQIVDSPAQAEFMQGAWAMVLGRLHAGVARASDPSTPMPPRPGRPKRRLPAAGAPLAQVRAFGAERGVVAVPRVHPGLVREPVEQALGHVAEQRGEVRGGVGPAHAAGEQRVPGEQVRRLGQLAARVVQHGQAARRVPAQVDERHRAVAEGQHLAVLRPPADLDRKLVRVGGMRDHHRTGAGLHLRQRLPVIGVPVRGHDGADRGIADHLHQPVRLVGRVDQQPLARADAAQQVGVVVHRAHRYLGHGQAAELTGVGRAADMNLSRVSHPKNLYRTDLATTIRAGFSPPGRYARPSWRAA